MEKNIRMVAVVLGGILIALTGMLVGLYLSLHVIPAQERIQEHVEYVQAMQNGDEVYVSMENADGTAFTGLFHGEEGVVQSSDGDMFFTRISDSGEYAIRTKDVTFFGKVESDSRLVRGIALVEKCREGAYYRALLF